MTRNHNYTTPNEGTIDWHVPLNENFELIDTDVEIRDEESNLDDYEPKSGAKFLATDSGAVLIGDGSSWNEIGAIGDTEASDDGDSISNPIGTDVPLWLDDDSNTGLVYNSDSGHVELIVNGTLISQWKGDGQERVNGEIAAESMKTTGGGVEIAGDGSLDLGGNSQLVRTDHINFADEVVEIGTGASVSRETENDGTSRHPIAIGHNAEATQLNCIAIGNDLDGPVRATADDAMAIGPDNAQATGNDAYAIGEGSRSSAEGSMAIGKAAVSESPGGIAIGSNTDAKGGAAQAKSLYSIAIGTHARVAPGEPASNNSIAIGAESLVSEPDSIGIGARTTVSTSNVARIGDGSVSQGPEQLVFTAKQDTIGDDSLNNGEMTAEMDEANDAFRLRGKDSNGTIREATIPW
jgi:hypothetical protein